MKWLGGISYQDLLMLPQEYYDEAITLINEQAEAMENL